MKRDESFGFRLLVACLVAIGLWWALTGVALWLLWKG